MAKKFASHWTVLWDEGDLELVEATVSVGPKTINGSMPSRTYGFDGGDHWYPSRLPLSQWSPTPQDALDKAEARARQRIADIGRRLIEFGEGAWQPEDRIGDSSESLGTALLNLNIYRRQMFSIREERKRLRRGDRHAATA